MKKLIFAAFAVVSFGVVSAQEVKFGAKGGLNFATLRGEDVKDVDMMTSFFIGGFAEIKLNEKFSFQPELLYSMQGTQNTETRTFSGGSNKSEGTLKLGYINIPLMFKYNITKGFNVEAGPQVGFLISADTAITNTLTLGSVTDVRTREESVKDEYTSFDFGLNFGAGYNFTDHFSAGLRYNLGLITIVKKEAGMETPKVYNGVISLGVGYTF